MTPAGQRGEIIDAATAIGATVIRAPGATVIVLADAAPSGDDQIALSDAAQIARCSVRTLTAARRAGELVMFGRQRSRTIKRADLEAWIESRRIGPIAGTDDADMDRRVARIERARAARRTGS